ncbi:hypothetical protein AVEN_89108-1 [Araneus ventricosus]|uniref:Uncharacterized protein n=1 Tax=Araneus ventricosus TaxID=182803 RepID=A0A4Y2B3M0_ARAVE|nr:hypothetical protein AVEN_89108-1 [Araneus ventricosus]
MRIESNDVLAKSIFSSQSLAGRMVRTPASRPLGREFYPGLCSYSVFLLQFAMSLQCKLAASSSYGDFEACVNLLQACFTLVVTNLQKAANLLQTKTAIWAMEYL